MEPDRDDEQIRTQAHLWRAVMDDSPTSRERSAFEAWLGEDPRHVSAYERAEAVWGLLADEQEVESAAAQGAPFGRRWGRVSLAIAAAAPVLLTLVIFLTGSPEDLAPPQRTFAFTTAPGEIRTVTLPDTSQVTLGGASQLKYTATARRRQAFLVQGDAFFQVAHIPETPFVVAAAPAEIEVLGTAFAVERREGSASVLVASGTVAIRAAKRRAGGSDARVVDAQQAVRVSTAGGVGAPRPIDSKRIAPWRSGRLSFEGAPLREVVRALDRYDSRSIRLADTSKADRPVTASLRLAEMEQNLQLLSESFDLEVRRGPTGNIELVPL
ncbi:MAG: FecR domain-containing protein [Pseudomonadota bacterium]